MRRLVVMCCPLVKGEYRRWTGKNQWRSVCTNEPVAGPDGAGNARSLDETRQRRRR
jgi:hypothetical protein